jgi:hypothetical protein
METSHDWTSGCWVSGPMPDFYRLPLLVFPELLEDIAHDEHTEQVIANVESDELTSQCCADLLPHHHADRLFQGKQVGIDQTYHRDHQ